MTYFSDNITVIYPVTVSMTFVVSGLSTTTFIGTVTATTYGE
jgi:hypothetical protein